MAVPSKDSVAAPHPSKSPYQVDPEQILRATKALVKHIQTSRESQAKSSTAVDLLADEETSTTTDAASDAIWLILATKKFISDKKRLKPFKLPLPHAPQVSEGTNICLITVDPQRSYKDVIAHANFPEQLRPLVKRVIGITKLKKKYQSFESRRQLLAEHTHFLADDRIITYLPHVLGKTFYQSTAKRPIPVSLQGNAAHGDRRAQLKGEKKQRQAAENRSTTVVGSPELVGKEIQKALQSALVNLSPAATTSVRVAFASWDVEKIRANVQALLAGMLEGGEKAERIIPGGWRNVKSIHLKGQKTTALPIWLSEDLWMDDDVVEAGDAVPAESGKRKSRHQDAAESSGKKAKLGEGKAAAKDSSLQKSKLQDQRQKAMDGLLA
ncbi:ribosomal protein L1 [Eremomyces bilateralis CBS 781.70]|uniref:Ribosomal protein L1 n=1 Tax=Eremomyces bilateralis CBS 781.70 TaxID=1392243 RepID=A0A6G1FQR7_9PEZI|nr:ribosomal protein L1 [Eremomyces bilateralis CBS 781.70]KAF1808175.1 ribosomal protein L1 [Eremomyces bilateralis CBS 781.70]